MLLAAGPFSRPCGGLAPVADIPIDGTRTLNRTEITYERTKTGWTMFEYTWKCAWGHADPQGIAYYPRLVDAMHRAGEEYMVSVGHAYWDIPDDFGIHLPLVAVDLEFERPVEVEDELTISVDPDVGTKSLGLEFVATHEDGGTAFTGREQHVCVSKAETESQPLPDEIRDAIEASTD